MGLGDSKLSYQQAVTKLSQSNVSPKEFWFWSQFWTLPTNAREIFTQVQPEDVRTIKAVAPNNLAILLNKTVSEMRRIVAKGTLNTSSDFKNALNCVRLITRLLPFIMEDQSDDFLESVFWRNEIPPSKLKKEHRGKSESSDAAKAGTPTTAADGTAKQSTSTEENAATSTGQEDQEEITVEEDKSDKDTAIEDGSDPLAIRLLNAVVNLLFYPNFTVAASKKATEMHTSLPLDRVWVSGIGTKDVLPTSTYMDVNRCEVLKCLLVLFSEALYRTPEESEKYVNKWLDIVACIPSYHSLGLFFSLVNASCSYDPIGWGVPYNHFLFSDTKEGLAETSLQVLSILLNHTPSALIPRDTDGAHAKNIFVEYLKTLQRVEDFEFIYSAMWQLLNNPVEALNTYLPNSTKMISCHQEMLMFFWKLIQENSHFLRWLLSKADITKVVDPILHFLHEGRKDSTQSGLIHLGTFILLFLSGEREFGVQLNKTFTRTLTIQLAPFTGNYADYLILVFHKMLVDGHERLESLYECLLTILANISPYIKSLSMITSIKLMNLFRLLSRPKFLFAAERNHRYVFFLLEFFNNCVQYQYEGNYRLIYAMIRDKEAFSELATLTLESRRSRTRRTLHAAEDKEKESHQEASADGEPTEKEQQSPAKAEEGTPPTAKPEENTPTVENKSEEESVGKEREKEDKEKEKKPRSIAHLAIPGFKPTEEWVLSWRNQLPISTIVRLLAAVVPQIPSLVSGSSGDETTILQYLKETTLVGLLPVPHPILIRRYQNNAATNMWFTTYMWGVIYLRNHAPPIFYSTDVKLFIITRTTTLDALE